MYVSISKIVPKSLAYEIIPPLTFKFVFSKPVNLQENFINRVAIPESAYELLTNKSD
jgi:hypothetical protein